MSKINSNAETKVQEGFKNAGADLMAPITAKFEKSAVVLRPKRSIGEFAKRIARRTSSLAQRRVTIKTPNTPNSKSTVIPNLLGHHVLQGVLKLKKFCERSELCLQNIDLIKRGRF